MQKTSLQLSGLATESGGATTAAMNLSNLNSKATAASGGNHPMTAGSMFKGSGLPQVTGENRMRHAHRGSLTYLS